MADPGVRAVTPDEIRADWIAFTGGPPVLGVLREYQPSDVEGLLWRDAQADRSGFVTWWIDGERAEITSVHADPPGGGAGTKIMDLAEDTLRNRGVRRIILATTNDNVRALNFYAKRGYRLIRIHLDAMDRVRAAKPNVPALGRDGILLRDLWELEKQL